MQVSAICAGLTDNNVLAVRGLLDILSLLFPLHRPFLLPADITAIVVAAMESLLKRDISLNRRLFAWLLGTNIDKAVLTLHLSKTDEQATTEDTDTSYFKTYSASYVEAALKKLCLQAASISKKSSAIKLDCIQPYRLLRALLEREEISEGLMSGVMLDVVSCLKEQVESLGGISGSTLSQDSSRLRKTPSEEQPKKLGRKAALKQDILQSANLFFSALDPGFLWQWLSELLETSLTRVVEVDKVSSFNFEVDTIEAELLEDVIDKIESPALKSFPSFSPVPKVVQLKEGGGPKVKQNVRMSCSFVISLTKFLLKSLPLVSCSLLHTPCVCTYSLSLFVNVVLQLFVCYNYSLSYALLRYVVFQKRYDMHGEIIINSLLFAFFC